MPTKQKIVAEFTRDELWWIIDAFELPVEGRRSFDHLRPAVQRLSKKALREILLGFDRDRLKEICRALGLDDSGKLKADIADRLIGGNDNDPDTDEGSPPEPNPKKEEEPDDDQARRPSIDQLKHEVHAKKEKPDDDQARRPSINQLKHEVRAKKEESDNDQASSELPRLFIGSTVEALPVAREVQAELDHEFDVTIWSQSLFNPGELTWSELVTMARNDFDFAILVFSADDVVESRGTSTPAPRDNVLLEYGLFVGAIGPERTFFLYDRNHRPKIASDLAGVTALDYRGNRTDGNLRAAVGRACTDLRKRCAQLGRRR